MAAANTMSMNFRDRFNEVGTLKSMGFSRLLVLGQIQTESILLCALGGLVGALGPYIVFEHTPMKDVSVPLILHLDVRPVVCAEAVGIALVIGLIAGAWPSWAAWRMKVVDALRNLE